LAPSGNYQIRDIGDSTDFKAWSLKLFTPSEIDTIIIESDLLQVKYLSPDGTAKYCSYRDSETCMSNSEAKTTCSDNSD
jgi:hypothetical protein